MRGALRSLLVTDIVASTRLWAEHESAMAKDLVTHDALVNAAIEAAGGRVFKHTGDGVMATFEEAFGSAVAAAEIQRALDLQAWQVPDGIRVRIALHSGSVHERDGDLFGPSVNRLARLLSRCPPRVVLVSEATASLLTDAMPPGLDLRELGRIELRDVGRSEAVHCLVGEHLTEVDAQGVLGAAGARAGSLPPLDDDLVGRSSEIAAVLDAIAIHPVVSIVGVGGMGKTRLALETASTAGLPDGAWWCDLTAATNPEAVPATVLAALGAQQGSGRSATESIVDHLTDQYALVVFDNCEHVVDSARALVSAIRAGCDKVRVLATSREALGLRGEHVIPLSSLPADDAIGLFCTRAGEARPDLQFDDPTLAAIDEICTRLDGIPLAVELAAARCRSMAPAEIAARLDDRFRLLRGGRGGVERHRTLHAAVEWSHSLLDDDERDLFDRMAVFAGGALIDALAAVGDLDEYDALDILDRLIARSMIVATDTPLGTRYRQLETLRQFAEDRLVEQSAIEETRDRHLAWVRALATWMYAGMLTGRESDGFRRYVAEIDNLRAAVHYAAATDRYQEGCEIISGLSACALYRPTFEIVDWLDAERISPEDWTDVVASTVGVFAAIQFFAGNAFRSAQLLATFPDEHRNDSWYLCAATYESLWVTGDFEQAEARLVAAAPISAIEVSSLNSNLGHVFQTRLRADRADDAAYVRAALAHGERCVGEMRALGAELTLVVALSIHGYMLEGVGDAAGAIRVQSEAIAISESVGAWFLVDAAHAGLVVAVSELAVSDGSRLRESASILRTAIESALQRGNRFFVASYLGIGVERVLSIAGDHRTAALVGTFGRLQFPETSTPANYADVIGAVELAEIEAEAARLDVDAAAAIGLAALDRLLAATVSPLET